MKRCLAGRLAAVLLAAALLFSLAACAQKGPAGASEGSSGETSSETSGEAENSSSNEESSGASGEQETPSSGEEDPQEEIPQGKKIQLSDEEITLDGVPLSESSSGVFVAHDIVYYEAGHDFTYGEGDENDEHTAEEAAAHTVVHITEPGVYTLSGELSAGQIAVDLGEDAPEDPEAVVTLVLDGVNITCTVAPAIIFYNVYECGSTEDASPTVDTSAAGANLLLAEGSVNQVNGSYVARIYKSVELNEAGTEVVDSKKLHKYDGAVYSKMSMNVDGTGALSINAENEGMDTELHLTINGGKISITSGNDGINTNEDGVSVTTVNGGELTITVNGSTGEGDGIDSNGWLVIKGGTVHAYACSFSGDAGIDSDMGILLNGGEIVATGNMLDAIDSASTQNYVIFRQQRGTASDELILKDADGNEILKASAGNDYSILIVSSPEIGDGLYALYRGNTLLASAEPGGESGMGGFGGFGGFGGPGGDPGQRPDRQPDGQRGELPEDFDPDEMPDGQPPEVQPGEPPEGFTPDL